MRSIWSLVIVVLLLLAAFLALVGRAVTPALIQAERSQLLGMLPLVQSAILAMPAGAEPISQIQKIKRISGLDVTVLDENNVIRATTLGGGSLRGSRLDVGGRG